MTRPPNILLVTSDQHHHSCLGVVNSRISTLALDRLAAEGTRFDRAYTPNPVCTPTRDRPLPRGRRVRGGHAFPSSQ